MTSYLEWIVQNYGLNHVSNQIFKNLDVESLLACQNVSTHWYAFIEDNRSLWLKHLRQLEDGMMKNHFTFDRHGEEDSFEIRYTSVNQQMPFVSKFPEWLKMFLFMETRNVKDIKIFLKHMVKYLSIDWNDKRKAIESNIELNQPPCPVLYAILIENYEFVDIALEGPFQLSEIYSDQLCEHTKSFIMNFPKRINPLLLISSRIGMTLLVKLILMYEKKTEGVEVESCCKCAIMDINTQTMRGSTPLHLASCASHSQIVDVLCQHPKIDINAKNFSDCTPLHYSCKTGNHKVVEKLCQRPEIDCNVKDVNGETPLHTACTHMHYKIVETLCKQHKIDVNTPNVHGWTPVHYACTNCDFKIVELLCQHKKVDINAKDKNGETPLMIAKKKKNEKIVGLLLKHSKSAYSLRSMKKPEEQGYSLRSSTKRKSQENSNATKRSRLN